jgi:hypothetical protein
MTLTHKTLSAPILTLLIVLLSALSVMGGGQTTNNYKVGAPVTITTSGMQEATVAVIPPKTQPRCWDGRLVFGSGTTLRSVPLRQGSGRAPFAYDFLPDMRHRTDLATPYIIDDNHLVASRGTLIYTVEGVIWRDNISPHPSWWNDTKTYPLKGLSVPGGRSAIFVFQSYTCGETWMLTSVVDAAELVVRNPATQKEEVGYCGVPRIDRANKTSFPGGWDGHYLSMGVGGPNYYLITTTCVSGKGGSPGLLLVSSGGYPDWRVLQQYDRPDNFWRVPVAQLSNQTLAVAYQQNQNLVLDVARFPYTTRDFEPWGSIPVSWPARLTLANIGLNASMYGYYNLVAATVLDTATGQTKEGFKIASFVNDKDDVIYQLYFQTWPIKPAPLKPFATIRAATKGRNPLHGTLVQSEAPGMSSIFYWVEELSKGQFQMRFQLFNHENVPIGKHTNISSTFTTPDFTGDYLGATSYSTNDGTHYFLSWSESYTLKYVKVFVPRSLSR